MTDTSSVTWNDSMRLVLSDVDETIADVYTPADPGIVEELASFLREGRKLFMVTGGSLKRVRQDITDFIPADLRHDILISHCSGAEVWGFTADGDLRDKPFYSVYDDTFTDEVKQEWRAVARQLVDEFGLRTHPVQAKTDFWANVGHDPLDIMLDDRGPQITMEVVNGVDLTADQLKRLSYDVPEIRGKYDLRIAIMNRAHELLAEHDIPVTPRLGGMFALDFAIQGVSKTTSIQKVLAEDEALSTIGLSPVDVQNPRELEIWGDKFSTINGGTDRHMCEAVAPTVRAIDFRQEDPAELPEKYNIVVWDGRHHLHDGLLGYLRSRHTD